MDTDKDFFSIGPGGLRALHMVARQEKDPNRNKGTLILVRVSNNLSIGRCLRLVSETFFYITRETSL